MALITGATRGLGESIVRRCAEAGCKVVFTGRNETAGAAIERSIRDAGGDALFVRCDVAVEGDVRHSVEAATGRYGRLTLLVNNAVPSALMGPAPGRPRIDRFPPEMSLEDWDMLLRLMLTGPTFLTSKYGIPELIKAGGGAIVQISSTQAFRANHYGVAYTAAKAAQIALMRHMALRYAPQNIRCNALALGVFPGPSTAAAPGLNDYYRVRTPLGSGLGDDVANAVVFLASGESRFITGETLVVDGGLTIYMPGSEPKPAATG